MMDFGKPENQLSKKEIPNDGFIFTLQEMLFVIIHHWLAATSLD
jgi:hypothetical protein